ncbi:MAG: hypothetical protein RL481_1037 [Pseudomonadota bacterium]|jgi:hypothetical protein
MKKAVRPQYQDPRPLVERAITDSDAPIRHGTKPRRTVTVNLAESPLSWLHAHGHLDERQFLAGEKLRSDYERACLGPRTTMTWEHMPVARGKRAAPSALNPSEHMIAAKRRFDGGIEALGRDLSDIAWRVICAGETVPLAEKTMGWPLRSGKLVLRIALDRLADYYRLPG